MNLDRKLFNLLEKKTNKKWILDILVKLQK